MKTWLARSFALIACIHLLGGHWLALQTVAWIGMLAENSQEASFSEAIEKTFDGEHPCQLCKVVESGQKQEKEGKEALIDGSTRLIAVLFVELQLPVRPVSELLYFVSTATLHSVAFVPHSPPPRLG